MPIGFNPEDTISFHLDCFDKEKPPEQRAKFRFRFLTGNQTAKVESLAEEANRAVRNADTEKLLIEAILIGLAGWENLKDYSGAVVAFAPEALGEFTTRLKFLIAREYPIKLMVSDHEKKV